jgi:hypothetical protein
MTGNIRVGLAAGECVGPVPSHRPRSLAWHATAAFGVALAIAVAAVWMNFPKVHVLSALRSAGFGHGAAVATAPVQSTALSAATIPESVVLEASPASIDLRAHGGTMSILTSREPLTDGHASSVAVSVSMQGSAGVQYVDSDTGQVTIGRVYYAQ